jgi:Family of unknown function (DUF6494)
MNPRIEPLLGTNELGVRQQLDAGELVGEGTLAARATVTVEGLPQEIVITGEIQLS